MLLQRNYKERDWKSFSIVGKQTYVGIRLYKDVQDIIQKKKLDWKLCVKIDPVSDGNAICNSGGFSTFIIFSTI